MGPPGENPPPPHADTQAVPHPGASPSSPTSSHRRAAFDVVAAAAREARAGEHRVETDEAQPEAEPEEAEEATLEDEDIPPTPFGSTPPELFEPPDSPPREEGVREVTDGSHQNADIGDAANGGTLRTSAWMSQPAMRL